MSSLYIAAAHKSSGKTALSVGIAAALTRRGKSVQCFKKGPDYIDPQWLSAATGKPCYNLDYNTQSMDEIAATFARGGERVDLSLIEGNKGLYDGVALDGSDANAALAVQLGVPVILVLDVSGITRGVAPLVIGYRAFVPDVQIAGVILNKVSGPRHESKLRAVLERYTDIGILGAVGRDDSLLAPERHLGLVPPGETSHVSERIDRLAATAEKNIDLEQLQGIAMMSFPVRPADALPVAKNSDVRIGIARDSSFGFYYEDDLEAFVRAGAELVPFNTLKDKDLPDVDGLFIGGGFPETHMASLEANGSLRNKIKQVAEAGMPIYAECGGLMYLARSINWDGQSCEMAGVLPLDVVMHEQARGRGLVRLEETGAGLWPLPSSPGTPAQFKAHEFHYASVENLPEDAHFAFRVVRGDGMGGLKDGIVSGNVVANFTHLRHTASNPWVTRFVDFVREKKKG